jgi:hypothetical protein
MIKRFILWFDNIEHIVKLLGALALIGILANTCEPLMLGSATLILMLGIALGMRKHWNTTIQKEEKQHDNTTKERLE